MKNMSAVPTLPLEYLLPIFYVGVDNSLFHRIRLPTAVEGNITCRSVVSLAVAGSISVGELMP